MPSAAWPEPRVCRPPNVRLTLVWRGGLGITMRERRVMRTASFRVLALCLIGIARVAAAQGFDQNLGHWVADGVTFQSGAAAHPFAVDVQRHGDSIQVTVPAELQLTGGRVYILSRVGPRVFRHVDDTGRIVEFSGASATRATLLITGSGGDGRITWQLHR